MFHYFQQRRDRKRRAAELYEQAVTQARLPVFYEAWGVPDNVDGRFEMISLHCYLFMRHLKRVGEDKLAQALFDVFFVNMDRTLREMGVGDLSVPKHMKRMMKGFNGRAHHYEQALQEQSERALREAVERNIYGTLEVAPSEGTLKEMVNYIFIINKMMGGIDLKNQDFEGFDLGTSQERRHA
ncbi:MAG: ubiquinol-cytochrome C chaperone family protein [Alphaproteobacteria bacterium]|nr:ubiquinol-cytochrome C chaperone family protein [Alphaproteobacteria bacterium]